MNTMYYVATIVLWRGRRQAGVLIREPFPRPPRLAEKFEFGGGKALPEEMTGPVMPIPSEARWKAWEKRRIAGVMRRRKGLPEEDQSTAGGSNSGGGVPATTMFDQVIPIG